MVPGGAANPPYGAPIDSGAFVLCRRRAV